ncbi:MAG: cysteine desulfurase-like protein [Thalassobaculales bacterium]
MTLDLAYARARFPALAGDWTFFDNAGGSQVLDSVAARAADYLLHHNVQHGASYAPSVRAAAMVRGAEDALAAMIGAASRREVVLGPSATALLDVLARSLAPSLRPGDEIIVTNADHEANIGCWRRLVAQGVVIREWRIDPASLSLRLADLAGLLGPRTRLVAVTHASNILGTIEPVAEIARMVHRAGAELVVDGVAYAPHRAIDVSSLGADFYVFSLYKVYGPHQGLLWGRGDRLEQLSGLNHDFIAEDDIPYKFQLGNRNYELAYASGAIPEYLAALADRAGMPAFEAIARHEEALADRLIGFLARRNDVRLIGAATADRNIRVPTISFVVEGRSSPSIVAAVDARRIGIRFGDFYARRLIDDLGLRAAGGVVRVSMVHYNTPQEVDALIGALEATL